MFTRPTPLPTNVPIKDLLDIPVVQLDYYTAELIEEYCSIRHACEDNELTHTQVVYALRRPTRTGYMNHPELRFMTIDDYDNMIMTMKRGR